VNLFKHLRFVSCITVVVALAAHINIARATPIIYDLSEVTTSEGLLLGTVTIDSVSGLVTAADITFNDASVGDPVFTNIGSPNTYNGLGQDYISGPSSGPLNYGGQIALYYDKTNLGSGALNICLSAGACGTETNQPSFVQAYVNGNGGPFVITGGKLAPAGSSVTPEPKTLLLFGTGILAIAGLFAWRRRPQKI
jgi:hypothetical protein